MRDVSNDGLSDQRCVVFLTIQAILQAVSLSLLLLSGSALDAQKSQGLFKESRFDN